jgi:hypothetical protein
MTAGLRRHGQEFRRKKRAIPRKLTYARKSGQQDARGYNEKALAEQTENHRAMYPEIYYKLEPLVSATCDAIEASGAMPSQQQLEQITDGFTTTFAVCIPIWRTI